MNAQRIGFFGGTFDPPHRGHLAVAQAAVAGFTLDRLLLAPTGHQPLKAAGASTLFSDRLAMVRLLCEGSPGLEASTLDAPLHNGGPNYTIDTLRRLKSETGDDKGIFVVVGADAFLDLRRWRSPDELLAIAEWIVVSRPGVELHEFRALELTSAQLARVHVLESVHVPVSATEVRARLAAGGDVAGMLVPQVADYIREHHLYGA